MPSQTMFVLNSSTASDLSGSTSLCTPGLISELLFELKLYIRNNKGTCKVLPAPLDVQLDCDNRTMIQPDISVICQLDRLVEKGVYGAPIFVLKLCLFPAASRDYIKKSF